MASPARGGQLVNPKSFIGIGRVPQQLTGNLDHDLMIDKEFHTLCPPDVQPNTRILGLCGAHDFRGNAGPIDDGCFFSDFYLFHHLLQSTRKSHVMITFLELRANLLLGRWFSISKANLDDLCRSY